MHYHVTAVLLAISRANGAGPVHLAAEALPMSDVTLTGGWAEQTRRNQETLLSLNMTEWLCHFTTTANLTACRSTSVPWQTYIKNKSDPSGSGFTYKRGFLAAGDDVKPPTVVNFTDCEAYCASTSACAGLSFQADAKTPWYSPVKCYWKRTAAHFTPQSDKANCITPGDPTKPVCEPLPGEMGLGGYYGHYQGHWLSATAFLINTTRNETIRRVVNGALAALSDVMEAWKAAYPDQDGYLFPYSPVVWDQLLAGRGAAPFYSVPFYTLHKLMHGLLDQWLKAGSALARSMLLRVAGWVHARVEATIASGGEELWQRVLLTEWGGMNDVLFALYKETADSTHLRTARRFNGYVFTAPLAAGHDDLADLPFPHANFHLPEIVGNAMGYELTGNATDAAIVRSFFAALTANHSYCTGGSNSGECWQQPRDLGHFLSTQTEESCTQYNVLKIARHLIRWTADAAAADFYERGILNGIVGNQRKPGQSSCGTPAGCSGGEGCRSPGARGASPATSYIYMLPLGGAVTKAWGKSDFGFPCCWGTLSESFAKLGDSIFFGAPGGDAFYVSLFVSATAVWAARPGVSIEQTSSFPEHPTRTSTLTVHVSGGNASGSAGRDGERFALMVRVPSWCKLPPSVLVNGEVWAEAPVPGTFLNISREWRDADQVELRFPPSLWAAPLNDYHPVHNATIAFMYGPLVLAGVNLSSDIFVPAASAREPDKFISRVSSAAAQPEFEAKGADGTRVRLIPLRDVVDERYVAYFYTAGTKPPQPPVVYCPHSAHGEGGHGHGSGEEAALVSAGAPPAAPPERRSGRGVQWEVDPAGQIVARDTPVKNPRRVAASPFVA